MKNPIRYFLVAICLFSSINLLHSQWVNSVFPTAWGSVTSLAVSNTNLFAGTSWKGVFLSTNNGASWTAIDSGLQFGDIHNPNYPAVYALAVSGTNLFAGTSGGIFISTNNGTSWTAGGLSSPYVRALVVSPASGGASSTYLIAETDDGVFLSTDNGTSWTAVDSGLPHSPPPWHYYVYSLAISPASGRAGSTNFFAGTSAGVFISTNNGTSWTADTSGLANSAVNALAVSGANLFAGTGNGVLLSTNNGSSWSVDTAGLTDTNVTALAVSGANIFAGTTGGNSDIFLSTNNGTSWRADGLTYPAHVFAFAVLPNGLGDTSIFAGTDNGIWQRPLSKIVPAIELNEYNIGFNLYLNAFYNTNNLRITNSSLAPLVIDSVYTTTKWFGVSSLHDTVTEQDTVSLLVSFIPDSARQLYKQYSDTLYIVSNSIYSLTKVPLSAELVGTAVSQNKSGVPKRFGVSQNYPNPFNPTTIINFQLPMSSFVTLKVYDILGREVKVLVNEKLKAGTYTVTFNADKLSSGIYFYRLHAGSFTETKRLLLLR